MKVAIITVASVLMLSGCTAMSHRAVDREPHPSYGGSPSVSSDKSESHPSTTGDASRDKSDTKKPSKPYYDVRTIPATVKKAVLGELKDLNEKDLAFIVVIDTAGSIHLLRANNEKIKSKSRRLTTHRVLIKSIVPFNILTYKGSPQCVSILHGVTVGGDFYEEYCEKWN